MTALELIAMNRDAYNKMYRRQIVYARIYALLRNVFLVVALVWCYSSRETLVRIVSSRAQGINAQRVASTNYTPGQ